MKSQQLNQRNLLINHQEARLTATKSTQRTTPTQAGRKSESVDFVGRLGVIGDEAPEDAHNLVASERHGRRRAVEWMSFDRSRPGHSAGEGACYDFGDGGHFAISIFPVSHECPSR